MIPVLERNYRPEPDHRMNVKIAEMWGDTRPILGDMVTVVEYDGYTSACCGHPVERDPFFIGKAVEIVLENVSKTPMEAQCFECSTCKRHYHLMEGIFKWGVCIPNEYDKGVMVGLHEIRPLGAGWNLDDIPLDPETR